MSVIDSVALLIKGFLLGGLGGLLLPALWMSIVFGGPTFVWQFSDGSNILAILTSLITIPFSTLFQGLLEGGLISATLFGAVSGVAVGAVVLLLRRFANRRAMALICGTLALIIALVIVLTRGPEITFATGLSGAQVWVLCVLYVAAIAWLGWKLREVSAA